MSEFTHYPAGTLIIARLRSRDENLASSHYHLALEGFNHSILTTVSDSKTLRVKVLYIGTPADVWKMAFLPEYKYDFVLPED